jgi:hypothetical protein
MFILREKKVQKNGTVSEKKGFNCRNQERLDCIKWDGKPIHLLFLLSSRSIFFSVYGVLFSGLYSVFRFGLAVRNPHIKKQPKLFLFCCASKTSHSTSSIIDYLDYYCFGLLNKKISEAFFH